MQEIPGLNWVGLDANPISNDFFIESGDDGVRFCRTQLKDTS